jgi:CheY-like chemotaxis protein
MTPRVLLVEDDLTALEALSTLLELDGYDVVAVATGGEAITALESRPFEVLITDLELPGVHGLEVVRAARQRGVPSLVVTAHSGLQGSALEGGARRVFGKPLVYDDLLAELQRALGPS